MRSLSRIYITVNHFASRLGDIRDNVSNSTEADSSVRTSNGCKQTLGFPLQAKDQRQFQEGNFGTYLYNSYMSL